MILSALAAVDETSTAFVIGYWFGRVVVPLIVVLLIGKYLVGQLSRPTERPLAPTRPAMSAAVAQNEFRAPAATLATQTILPVHPDKRRRGN